MGRFAHIDALKAEHASMAQICANGDGVAKTPHCVGFNTLDTQMELGRMSVPFCVPDILNFCTSSAASSVAVSFTG